MKFPFKTKAASKLLSDDETYAFVLITICLAAYGENALDSVEAGDDAALLFQALEEDFDCRLSEQTENKINAAITAMTTDLFYTNRNVFDAIALAFSEGDIGGIPDGDEEEVSGHEALWAIVEVALLNDDEAEDTKSLFARGVRKYIGDLIGSEAVDLEEVNDDVDSLEEAMDEPFYQKYIATRLRALGRQLVELGCDPRHINELLEANDLASDEDE